MKDEEEVEIFLARFRYRLIGLIGSAPQIYACATYIAYVTTTSSGKPPSQHCNLGDHNLVPGVTVASSIFPTP